MTNCKGNVVYEELKNIESEGVLNGSEKENKRLVGSALTCAETKKLQSIDKLFLATEVKEFCEGCFKALPDGRIIVI